MNDFDEKIQLTLRKKGYWLEKKLTEGAFGHVYRAVKYNRKQCQRIAAAAKVMYLSQIDRNIKSHFLISELDALIHLTHRYIVEVYEIFRSNNLLFIMMEFAPNGDIHDQVILKGKLTEPIAGKWFSQMVLALHYVHQKHRMAHRDIKLNNVLLDASFDAKLSDFGFARRSWDNKSQMIIMARTDCGTPQYFSPQIHKHQVYNPFLADSWAMGVSLFFMLVGDFPFDCEDNKILAQQFNYPNYIEQKLMRNQFSKSSRSTILKLLHPEENRRMTITQLKNNCEWLKRYGVKEKKGSIKPEFSSNLKSSEKSQISIINQKTNQ